MAAHNELGAWGEGKAAEFLKSRGYQILQTNFRSRFGEIDIIAEDDEYLVFVEVRVRKTDSHGRPEETVDRRKQRKLRVTAEYYLQYHHTDKQPRFDIVAFYAPNGIKTSPIPVRHVKNAF